MSGGGRSLHQHEEESFFVSMTDIMVGLLFIFILIIMYFAVQAKIDTQKIEELSDQAKILTSLITREGDKKRLAEIDAYQAQVSAQRTNILRWLQAQLSLAGVQGAEIIEEQGVLRLPEGILFASGEYEFVPGSRSEKTAVVLARALQEVLPCSVLNAAGLRYRSENECDTAFYHNKNLGFVQAIYVEGHTDSQPIKNGLRGDPKLTTNLKLSARRASNTFELLTQEAGEILEFRGPTLGSSEFRFEPVLASAAYGEWRPAASNGTAEGRSTNRRIDLRVVMYTPANHDAMMKFAEQIGERLTTVFD